MAIVKFINNNATLKTTLNYIMKEEKTENKLIAGKDCIAENALEEMNAIKKQYNKYRKGRDKIHFIQSFSPKDNITPELANEIGMKMAEYFKGFQVVVATHIDKNHLHNHIVLNSVNFENGLKFHQSKSDLQKIKKFSDQLCKEYGLTITEEKAKVDDIKINEYKSRQKGESWKYKLEKDIDLCMKKSNNKFEFFKEMNSLGYKVTWTKERKNITFTTPDGKKCRDRKLHNVKYLKDNMSEELIQEWTVYILPVSNPDGQYNGWTNQGPGRTTVYSWAPENKGIDMNRCFPVGWTKLNSSRNYTGEQPLQAYEAEALREFILTNVGNENFVIDVHGWLNETIGNNELGSFYRDEFGISNHIGTYGKGYFIQWARSIPNTKSMLLELPEVKSHNELMQKGYVNKFNTATMNLLKSY